MKSFIRFVGCAHSHIKCSSLPSLSLHVTSRLLYYVGTLPAHPGQPVGFLSFVRCANPVLHVHPHSRHVHRMRSALAFVSSPGENKSSSNSSSNLSPRSPFSRHHSTKGFPGRAFGGGHGATAPRRLASALPIPPASGADVRALQRGAADAAPARARHAIARGELTRRRRQ